MAEAVGSSDLVQKLKGPDSVPIIDGKGIGEEYLIDSLTIPPDRILVDNNAITSGSYNIGSGETYTTLAAFAADIGTQTADLTGTITSSITETAVARFDHGLGGFKTTLTSNAESYGYPNTGYIVSINHNSQGILIDAAATGGDFDFSKFYLKSITGTTSFLSLLQIISSVSLDMLISDVMLDCNSGKHNFGITTSSGFVTYKMFNIIAWDAASANFQTSALNSNSVIENCTAYNGLTGFNCCTFD